MNTFITSQFSYCPLVWVSHSRNMNNRINRIHEKSLRLVYKNIHQRNLQILGTEIYKVRNGLGPEIMKDIFHFVQEPYNLKNDSTLQRRRNRTVYFGTESISSVAPKIWEIVPSEIENAKPLDVFFKKRKL